MGQCYSSLPLWRQSEFAYSLFTELSLLCLNPLLDTPIDNKNSFYIIFVMTKQ